MSTSRLKLGNLCLVWQKSFTGKHKIRGSLGKCQICGCRMIMQFSSVHCETVAEDGQTRVVHRNLLMHIAYSHQQEGCSLDQRIQTTIQCHRMFAYLDSTLSTTGPGMWSQTKAHQLAQSIQDTRTGSPIHPTKVEE